MEDINSMVDGDALINQFSYIDRGVIALHQSGSHV